MRIDAKGVSFRVSAETDIAEDNIHAKAYMNQVPVIVTGGLTGGFVGEYQAGGIITVLGLGTKQAPVFHFLGVFEKPSYVPTPNTKNSYKQLYTQVKLGNGGVS